jgi:hypothetical protein
MSDEPLAAKSRSPVRFTSDIRPLFRDSDQAAMRGAFDLWSYEDVVTHGEAIAGRLKEETMPCDGQWPKEQVTLFERWVAQGGAE